MLDLVFTLNRAKFTRLTSMFGSFIAFSGDGPDRNNPDSAATADHGAIPVGRYYLIDRQSGGKLGWVRDLFRDHWFALYSDDGKVDDETFIGDVRRGEFRLHPLGPRAMSTGRIVLQYKEEFDTLRKKLTAAGTSPITGSSLRAYGLVHVIREEPYPAILEPEYRRAGTGAA
jgi:hypothetical protein